MIVRMPTPQTRRAIAVHGTLLVQQAISSAIRPISASSRSGSAMATMIAVIIRTRTTPLVLNDLAPATVSVAPTTTDAFRQRGIATETTIAATVIFAFCSIALNESSQTTSLSYFRSRRATRLL